MHDPLPELIRSGQRHAAAAAATGPALDRSYRAGGWTLRELLWHLADAETVFLDRVRRLAADEKPLLWAYDEDRWARALAYGRRDAGLAGALFRASREALIDLVRHLPAELRQRRGVHSEAGAMTIEQVLAKTVAHTDHHLDQAEACIAGRGWTPR